MTPRLPITAPREDPPLCAHQHADDIPRGVGPASGEYDGAPPLAITRPRPGRTPAKAGGVGRGVVPPVRGACGAGAVVARPGSQGGSRDFLLEEAALWQLPVGDGGGGWGKGPPAFIETRWRGAGSAGAGGRRAGAPLPHPDYSAANPSAEAAPGKARGPCAVTAPHCLEQPPSMGFWPGRRLSRDHRDAATGAELRSVPAVPPRGTPCARCPGKWQNPLPRAPQTWHPICWPVPRGPGAGQDSSSPLRPQPCVVPGTGTFCTRQQAMQPGQLPQTCPQAQVCR